MLKGQFHHGAFPTKILEIYADIFIQFLWGIHRDGTDL